MNKTFALALQTLLLVLALATSVHASSDDAAFGHYSAVGGKTSLSFDWDEEGIHHFHLNDRSIKETLSIEEREKSSSVQVFEIPLPAKGDRQQWLQMLVLFDANGMKAAAGILSDKELVKVGTGAEIRVRSAQVLELHRRKPSRKRWDKLVRGDSYALARDVELLTQGYETVVLSLDDCRKVASQRVRLSIKVYSK